MSTRPLPLLTPTNEFYWTSGADGRLRFQKCGACSGLIHPPKPVCPYCHSDDLGVTEVSGHGRLAGFTQNFQQWHPAFAAPYVVGMVVLDEDPRVRLTTNVVGCEPDAVRSGCACRSCSSRSRTCWLPLFEPTGEPPAAASLATPPDPRASAHGAADGPRRQVRGPRWRSPASALSRIGRKLMVDPLSLTVEACRRRSTTPG